MPILRAAQDDVMAEIDKSLYFGALAELSNRFTPSLEVIPDWTNAYISSEEGEILREVDKRERQISVLAAELKIKQQSHDQIRELKQLFTGTGDEFVRAVKSALETFQLRVVDGPHPRADLLAFDGSTLLAIEAKGVEGPVRELYVRETEQWLSDLRRTLVASADERKADMDLNRYADKLSALGIDLEKEMRPECRGLMIINTFRKTPLMERIQIDFPDPVSRTINRSDVRALTGLQLFGLLCKFAKARTKQKRYQICL